MYDKLGITDIIIIKDKIIFLKFLVGRQTINKRGSRYKPFANK